jgi:hypothetical protein
MIAIFGHGLDSVAAQKPAVAGVFPRMDRGVSRDRNRISEVRNGTETAVQRRQIIPVEQQRGTAMDKITEALDGMICEIAAIVWLVRAAATTR